MIHFKIPDGPILTNYSYVWRIIVNFFGPVAQLFDLEIEFWLLIWKLLKGGKV